MEFAGEFNYSSEQIAFLNQYAADAAGITVLATRKEQEELIAVNPLFQLDLALLRAGEEKVLTERKSLRNIQREIKTEAQRVTGFQEGEPSADEIVDEMLKGKDHQWKVILTSGRINLGYLVLVVLGGDELADKVHNESRGLAKSSANQTKFAAPTVFDGISSEISLSLRNGPPTWINIAIIFDRETVKKVIETPDLPPLTQE